MGNQLMAKLCNDNSNQIEGFNDQPLIISKLPQLTIPQRQSKVQQVYQLISQEKVIDYSLEGQKNSFNPIIINIFQQHGIYIGWMRNDKPHGPGQLYFNNNNYLEAIFKQGEVDCEDGIFIESNGNYYRGSFKNSKQDGLGILKADNDKIIGNFSNGYAQGKGQKIYSDGRIYRGQFKNGKMEGKGTLSLQNNYVYQGYFRQNVRNGIGKLTTNQYEYFGPFQNDVMNGKGTLIFKDGTKFQGWFEQNRIQGYGQWHRPNGNIQKGNYSINLSN